MPWFKVDDKFHSSRKLNSIPKRHRLQAAGLWAVAGSWVSGESTDGFVPDYMIEAWGPTSKTVECLVNAGLWESVRGGFVFCSWLEYNPSKAQTEAERAASAERMRKSRERRRDERAGRDTGSRDVAAQQSEALQRNTHEVLQRPDPTRPDPTPKETSSPPSPATVYDFSARSSFDDFWNIYPRKVGKEAAKKAFTKAVKQAGAETVLEGARRFAADPNLPDDKTFIPHASTWLNRGSWEDEPMPARSQGMWAGTTTRPDALRDSKSGLLVER